MGPSKRKSRRVSQRTLCRTLRSLKKMQKIKERFEYDAIDKNNQDIYSIVPCAIRSSNRKRLESYPTLPVWKNIENVLGDMTKYEYFSRPSRMAFHNLCTKKKPPDGVGSTLGLSLKFCVQSDRIPNCFDGSFERFANDV